jgi:hypothetical protein
MRRLILATGAAALVLVMAVGTVAAAGPMGRGGGTQAAEQAGTQADAIAEVLGMTRAAIDDLRHGGLSLAQIAERQKVDPQKLVDALVAQWTARIAARLELGALTASEATKLRTELETRARDMVYKVTLGGMQGAAVGAGPANAPGNRNGAGNATDPAAGTIGRGRGAGNGVANGAGRGAGNGACDGTGRQAAQP